MSQLTIFMRQWCFAACVGIACIGAAHAQGVTDSTIVLGQNLSLQSGSNGYGVAAAAGMKLYFDQVNAAGGVHGRKIVSRIFDDDSKAEKAEANARQLVADSVFILFGSIDGGPSAAVMKAANELKVPFFGPLAGAPNLRSPHQPLVFPVRAEHKDEFEALMTWGKNTGLKTVGFLRADTPVGQLHLGNVQRIAKELGLQFVQDIPFSGDESDAQIAGWIKSIGVNKPDMVLNHGSATLYTKLVAGAKAAGLKTTFMAVNSGSSQIAKALGPLANGMVFAQVVPRPTARKFAITREYQDAARKADSKAEFSYGGLEGYMTAKAFAMTLQANGRDLTRARWLQTMSNSRFDLGGVVIQYRQGNHEGARFVDLSMVDREGRFLQ
ncbi:MAG: ABC transporter substrate-binding protein [Rhodoferax sp.]|uniref:ABC transporter substrate-binding protein n=1 Tax=Rhodoferax sp. TaxID=50421 RepID=UPI002ACD62E4|nr:ABC transporter substrate-binding protein [Rhodoferax sp.]MDZ7891156.1 ABC transporter substrate-binding protein [Rhodoferax sp.]